MFRKVLRGWKEQRGGLSPASREAAPVLQGSWAPLSLNFISHKGDQGEHKALEWGRLLPAATPQDLLWQQMRVMTRDSRRTPQIPAKGAQMKILQSKSNPLFFTDKVRVGGI